MKCPHCGSEVLSDKHGAWCANCAREVQPADRCQCGHGLNTHKAMTCSRCNCRRYREAM